MKKNLILKKANGNHIRLLYKWHNLKSVLKTSKKGERFDFKTHETWYFKQLNSQNLIYIIYIKYLPIGTIRLEKKNSFYFISYMIAPKFRKRGYGLIAVEKLINKVKNIKLVAIVKKNNYPSIKIFQKLNFSKSNLTNNKLFFKFRLN